MNVIRLKREKSYIAASNVMSNIEEASPDEHNDLLASLRHGKPVIFIGEDNKEEEDDDDKTSTDGESFDFHAKNYLNITIPL
jgi:hypothetical protein